MGFGGRARRKRRIKSERIATIKESRLIEERAKKSRYIFR